MNAAKIQKIVRYFIIGFFLLMIVIDVYLVVKAPEATFSQITKNHRSNLIWLTFMYGGLVSKLFYFRKTSNKFGEIKGLAIFLIPLIILLIIGIRKDIEPTNIIQLLLMLSGGILSYWVWPQFDSGMKEP